MNLAIAGSGSPSPGPSLPARLLAISWLFLAAGGALQAERLPVRYFTVADGLAHDRVKCVVDDPQGFLWFCTALGLSHFDGQRFASYGVDDGLPHASVNDLLVAPDGTYWAATNGGGVASFRPEKADEPLFVASSVDAPLPGSERVNALFRDRDGRFWAGTDAGLFAMDVQGRRASFRPVPVGAGPAGASTQVWALDQGTDGRLWIGTSRGLVVREPSGTMHRHQVAPDGASDHVWSVHVDRNGRLWIGHDRGLVVWWPGEGGGGPGASDALPACLEGRSDGSGRIRLPGAPGSACRWLLPEAPDAFRVRALFEAGSGAVWFGGDGGIGTADASVFRLYGDEIGHLAPAPQSLGEDRAGNLWFGTAARGAARLARSGLVSFGPEDGLAGSTIQSIQEAPSGALYVVSPRLWIHRHDGASFEAVQVNLTRTGAQGERTLSSHPRLGRDGTWWLPTRHGLYRIPPVERLEGLAHTRPLGPWTREDGLHGDDVWRVFPDSRGDLWIGTRRPGREVLTRWDRSTGTFHRYSDRHGLPANNPPVSFWESPEGHVWIGFWEGGVARYRDGRFDVFGTGNGIPGGYVLAFAEGPGGRLWIGGYGGVAEVLDRASEAPRFRTPPGTEGLVQVTSLASAGGGALFAGTASGLYRIDPTTGARRRYSVSDGLAASDIRTLHRDRVGRLWIGTSDGLSRLDPGPTRSGPPPRPRITGVWVDGEPLPLPVLGSSRAGPYRLRRSPARVRLEVGAISHAPGSSVRLRLRSDGRVPEPRMLRSESSIVLSRPSAGRHELRIEAVDADGRTIPEEAVVELQVPPPLWRRPWALAIAVAFVVGSLTAAHRLRVRRLLEIERVRTRIAGDLHDDLGAQLTRMSILSEVARGELGSAPERAASRVAEIGDNARALIDSMSDIVWSIAPGHDRLASLAARIRRYAAELFEESGVRWSVTLDGADAAVPPDQRRHLLLIAKEALHNALRHAEATRVAVTLGLREEALHLEIVDDGRGFAVHNELGTRTEGRTGHGLSSLQLRARELGGELTFDAASGSGTRVRLTVPRRRPRA